VATEEPSEDAKTRFSIEVWQRYASPVWLDIDQTKTLNYQQAREQNDERHICPLQLDVVERCLDLWTNPGDLVFSPFTGIGTEGYESLLLHRRFVGSELKRSYFDVAVKNLTTAADKARQKDLFSDLPAVA
jgi:DNA modification methylase